MDDVELIARDGSNLVITANHGDLGRHGFGRRVSISGTAVMSKDRTTRSGLLIVKMSSGGACEWQGSGLPGG